MDGYEGGGDFGYSGNLGGGDLSSGDFSGNEFGGTSEFEGLSDVSSPDTFEGDSSFDGLEGLTQEPGLDDISSEIETQAGTFETFDLPVDVDAPEIVNADADLSSLEPLDCPPSSSHSELSELADLPVEGIDIQADDSFESLPDPHGGDVEEVYIDIPRDTPEEVSGEELPEALQPEVDEADALGANDTLWDQEVAALPEVVDLSELAPEPEVLETCELDSAPEGDLAQEVTESIEPLDPSEIDYTPVYEGLDEYDLDGIDIAQDAERLDQSLESFQQEAWSALDMTGQKDSVENLADYVSDTVGLNSRPTIDYYSTEDATDYGYYTSADNVLHINEYNLHDADETADTVAHELWHAYQHQCAENPRPGVAGAIDWQRQYGLNPQNYISPQHDEFGRCINFEDYQDQLVEAEARAFASQIKDRLANLGGGI